MDMDDWKFTLLVAMCAFSMVVFTGDVAGLLMFSGFYYIALKTFNKEKYNEQ